MKPQKKVLPQRFKVWEKVKFTNWFGTIYYCIIQGVQQPEQVNQYFILNSWYHEWYHGKFEKCTEQEISDYFIN